MTRKTALRLDDDPLESTARVPSKSRGRRRPADGQLVGEVISLAFDRCEAAVGEGVCGKTPDAICTGCGTARCPEHTTGAPARPRCSTCSSALLLLASATFEEVLDARLHFG